MKNQLQIVCLNQFTQNNTGQNANIHSGLKH